MMTSGRRGPLRRLITGALSAVIATAGISIVRAQAPVPAGGDQGTVVLQAGDELSIKVFGQPQLDDTVIVRPDGRISVAIVDDVAAAGLTVAQLDASLTSQLGRYFRDPQVTVVVRRLANLKVFVGGEVGRPGVVAISGELTALGAVFEAGGFRTTARTDSVMLVRNSDGKPVTTRLDLKRIEQADALTRLQPHDVLYVPMSRIAKVDQFIDQYARQLLPISLNAGFTYLVGNGNVFTGQ